MAEDVRAIEELRREMAALRARVDELAAAVERSAAGPPASPGQPAAAPQPGAGTRRPDLLRDEVRALLAEPDRTAGVLLAVALRRDGGEPATYTRDMVCGPGAPGGDLREIARVLTALGSDARLRLMQMLWEGEKGAPELAEKTGLTTGSLYHHMRELTAFRWVDAPQRNRYVLTPAGRKALALACALGPSALPGAGA